MPGTPSWRNTFALSPAEQCDSRAAASPRQHPGGGCLPRSPRAARSTAPPASRQRTPPGRSGAGGRGGGASRGRERGRGGGRVGQPPEGGVRMKGWEVFDGNERVIVRQGGIQRLKWRWSPSALRGFRRVAERQGIASTDGGLERVRHSGTAAQRAAVMAAHCGSLLNAHRTSRAHWLPLSPSPHPCLSPPPCCHLRLGSCLLDSCHDERGQGEC